jgi:hypothetical protein
VANIHNGNDLRIGRSLVMDVARFSPNALLDDVRIYDSALSPAPDSPRPTCWPLSVDMPRSGTSIPGNSICLHRSSDSSIGRGCAINMAARRKRRRPICQ